MSAGARRILVVDDDPMVATTIQRVLRPEGYEVDVALGGVAALDRAREQRPDLVVLDLMMPGLDGLEVCRRLRADGALPILMLTARSGTADRVRGLDTGADDYLVKPFAYAELLARVRALLRRAAVDHPPVCRPDPGGRDRGGTAWRPGHPADRPRVRPPQPLPATSSPGADP